MGTIRITFSSASALIIMALAGCTTPKTNEPPVNVLSPDIIAGVVASTLCNSSGGIDFEMETALNYKDRKLTPGVIIDSTFEIKKNDSAAKIVYDYQAHYQFGRDTNPYPGFNFNFQADGNYTVSGISCTGTQTGTYYIANADAIYCHFYGTGSTNGTYTAKKYNLSFTCNIQYIADRTVHLWNHNLGAGTINIAANGTDPSNQPYSYTGLVTFISGTNNCDFVFNGAHYLFDIASGSLQKQ
jgi:hypothetical protein